ncbi:MAG: hypothetical protein U9N86_04530 [Bacteroidota bacterium]|nr:hypothetical protein [Bacteroidota bacterium]
MITFDNIREVCHKTSELSRQIIDEFLLYYAADKYIMEQPMLREFAKFRHITDKLDPSWVRMFHSQYIVHKIFRTNGLIHKILNHSRIQRMTKEEKEYLEHQAQNPWRFSFGYILKNPEGDFYEMKDAFSGEEYLLHSPGMTDTLKEKSRTIWFNLISFNGECWQSFGPILGFAGIDSTDVFFFATEIDLSVETENAAASLIDKNPIPFMMLISGMEIPATYNNDDKLMHLLSEFDLDQLDTSSLKGHFKIEYAHHVYKLELKSWNEPPHFATAFYDEKEKIILLTAMTDRAFRALAKALDKAGYHFEADPFVRVSLNGFISTNQILNKKVILNEYAELFSETVPEDQQEGIDKLNYFMSLVLPDINAGKTPDIEAQAAIAGIDIELARQIVDDVMGRLK